MEILEKKSPFSVRDVFLGCMSDYTDAGGERNRVLGILLSLPITLANFASK